MSPDFTAYSVVEVLVEGTPDVREEVVGVDTDGSRLVEVGADGACEQERAGLELSGTFVECRAASCRVIMQEPAHTTVTQHQAALGSGRPPSR